MKNVNLRIDIKNYDINAIYICVYFVVNWGLTVKTIKVLQKTNNNSTLKNLLIYSKYNVFNKH